MVADWQVASLFLLFMTEIDVFLMKSAKSLNQLQLCSFSNQRQNQLHLLNSRDRAEGNAAVTATGLDNYVLQLINYCF